MYLGPTDRQVLGVLPILRKATIGFVMSVLLSVRVEQLGSQWRDFREIWYLMIFSKICRENSFHSNRTKLKVTLHEDQHTFLLSYLAHFFLEWDIFQTKVIEKIKIHIFCSVTFFSKVVRLWENVEKYYRGGKPQMTIWRKCIACWIPKATNTHTQVV
jgi:hypothetical protein